MRRANIVWSTIRTSALVVAAGSQFTSRIVNTGSQQRFAVVVPDGEALLASSRIAAPRLLSNRVQASLPVAVQPTPPIKTVAAPAAPPERAETAASDAPESAAPAEAPARPAPTNERVQLIIDSLQNYELIKPIPVVVDSLADKIFTAEAPNLNLSISDKSFGGALLLLKDRIAGFTRSTG
jgi:hypothetical protein